MVCAFLSLKRGALDHLPASPSPGDLGERLWEDGIVAPHPIKSPAIVSRLIAYARMETAMAKRRYR
jgi:hypothetical protein